MSSLTILGYIEMLERSSHDQYGGQQIWDVVHVTWWRETPTGQVGRSECAAVPSLCQAGASMQRRGSNVPSSLKLRRVSLKAVLKLSNKYLWDSSTPSWHRVWIWIWCWLAILWICWTVCATADAYPVCEMNKIEAIPLTNFFVKVMIVHTHFCCTSIFYSIISISVSQSLQYILQ